MIDLKAPTLGRVIRLDSTKLGHTFFTEEGYLRDRPILTSTGIFEYHNPDGSVRRELRIPEEVFDPESLASYEGKPIIITHDAGLVDKNNVTQHQIGTILTKGYQDGDDVRAEIVINDTDSMKACGLKELSLGYSLDLDETPGVYNGERYDAVQRNIRINHLALVREARAGDQARLNIDSRDSDSKILKGEKIMSKKKTRKDGAPMTKEEFAKAVADFQKRRAERMADKQTAGDDEDENKPLTATAAVGNGDDDTEPAGTLPTTATDDDDDVATQVQNVKDRRDRRDAMGDPANMSAAKGVIADSDEDIDTLLGLISKLLAKLDFKNTDGDDDEGNTPAAVAEDDDDEPMFTKKESNDDDDDEEDPVAANTDDDDTDDDQNCDDDDDDDTVPAQAADCDDMSKANKMNTDSMDKVVRTRLKICRIGDRLNMDGLENMSTVKAKKAIIKRVNPNMRLDGKDRAYIDAAFDMAVAKLNSKEYSGTNRQRRSMFNADSVNRFTKPATNSAAAKRNAMIARHQKED